MWGTNRHLGFGCLDPGKEFAKTHDAMLLNKGAHNRAVTRVCRTGRLQATKLIF